MSGPSSVLSVRQHWLWSGCRKTLTIHTTVVTSVNPSPHQETDTTTVIETWCATASNAVLPEEQLEFEAVSPYMHQVTWILKLINTMTHVVYLLISCVRYTSSLSKVTFTSECTICHNTCGRNVFWTEDNPRVVMEMELNTVLVMWATMKAFHLIGLINTTLYTEVLEVWLIPQLGDVWVHHNGAPAHSTVLVCNIFNKYLRAARGAVFYHLYCEATNTSAYVIQNMLVYQGMFGTQQCTY